jgi:hypothetical protein
VKACRHFAGFRTVCLVGILFVAVSLSIGPTAARAQYDLIAVYSDTTRTDCNVTEYEGPTGWWLVFYVFHYSAGGAQGARFACPRPNCFTEYSYFGAFEPFPGVTGTPEDGVTIPYGSCLRGWTHVLTVVYYTQGNPGVGVCCEYPISPHPQSMTGSVEVLNCASNWVAASHASAFVNANASCPCEVTTGIPESDTTWGGVKALYGGQQ